jgi:glycosyltransferase involved in cell wall biosynthesis
MSEKPFFSIIVPAHNSAKYIWKCLNSVKKQTFKDYELIVVCDACTDNTSQVSINYADRVLVRNFGRDGLARNAGIEAAEGEWLLFLDDDDWWIHEYVLERLHHYATHTDADLLPFQFIWPNDAEGRYYWDHAKYGINIAPWSKMYRRSFVGDVRFSDKERTSDEAFAYGLIEKLERGEGKYFFIHELYYYYNYMRPGSQTEVHSHEQGTL